MKNTIIIYNENEALLNSFSKEKNRFSKIIRRNFITTDYSKI